jgi:hypothetical protein
LIAASGLDVEPVYLHTRCGGDRSPRGNCPRRCSR